MHMLHSSIVLSSIVQLQQLLIFSINEQRRSTHRREEIDMTTMITASATFGARVANFFNGLRARRARYAIYRETLRELEALRERELNDLGIHRAAIRGIAYQAAYQG